MPGEAEYKAPLLLSYACPVKWEAMEGDGSVRNCQSCACKVQEISDYSQSQIDELLVRVDAGEQICVAFRRPEKLATPTIVQIFNQNNRAREYWLDITNHSGFGISAAREAPLPPRVTRFSIALAASISLSYVIPSQYLAAQAQDPGNWSHSLPSVSTPLHQKKDVPNESMPPGSAPAKCAKEIPQGTNAKPVEDIQLETAEYGRIAGVPAPSKVRDLVGGIGRFSGDFRDIFVFPLMRSFNGDVEQGHISMEKVESLAVGYSMCGQISRARQCYSLLLEVAGRQHADPKRVQEWHKQLARLAPKEFEALIKEYDANLAKKDYDKALDNLTEANSVRKLTPELAQSLSWREIARRMDLLQLPPANHDRANFLRVALELFSDEKMTPEQQHWSKSEIDLGLRIYADQLAQSDKEFAQKRYADAMRSLSYADTIGAVDDQFSKLCDWPSLDKRLRQLQSHLEGNDKDLCGSILDCLKYRIVPPAPTVGKRPK